MPIPRRTLLGAMLPAVIRPARSQPLLTVRVGTLRFGTVSWEVDTIGHHGLDSQAGVTVAPVSLAAPQAAQVALQAGRVDTIVADWLLVARLRGSGADDSFVPFSNAVGALIAPAGSPVQTIPDLAGKALGVAGTPLDKSWLILRAYAAATYGIDLNAAANTNFGPPPLLAEQMGQGRLDALLTFWPYAAKAEAAGARRILAIEDAVKALGVAQGVPYLGYIFSATWARQNPAAIGGFLSASKAARAILGTSDAEWQRIRPLTGAASDAEFERLKAWYRQGIPAQWGAAERDAAAKLFAILAKIGGPELVGPINAVPDGTFWPVTW